jgi:hypothetical protein
VALSALLEDLQDLQAGERCLQAGTFEFVDIGHGCLGLLPAQGRRCGLKL